MRKTDYIKLIKEASSHIDLDDIAERIFDDYLFFDKESAKEILKKINSLPNDNFYTNNEIKLENYVNFIYAGSKNNENCQYMYHKFIKKEYSSELSCVVVTNLVSSVVDTAIIENLSNYVKQLFNLAKAVGSEFQLGYPKNPNNYHYLIESDISVVCHLTRNKQNKFFHTLLYRYMYFNLMLFDKRIHCKNKQEKIKEIIKKSKKTKKLYEYLKNFFDNTNFIYAILTYLNTEEKIDKFNLCIEKNENWHNHEKMNDVISMLSAAYYMYSLNEIQKSNFICDYVAEFTKSKVGELLYKKILKIIGNENSTYCSIVNIKTEEEKQEVLDFIVSENADYYLTIAYCDIIKIKRTYKNGAKKKALKDIEHVINFWAKNYTPFILLQKKMLNDEEI